MMKEFTVGHASALDNAPPDAGRFTVSDIPDLETADVVQPRVHPTPSGDNVGYTVRDEMDNVLDDEAPDPSSMTNDEAKAVVRETIQTDPNQAARMMMVSLDPLLRQLPYEQRTATLLNLLVTYAAEHPAALKARGKFINAMTQEFRLRLQQFLPMLLG